MAGIADVVLSPTFISYGTLVFVIVNAVAFVFSTLRPKDFPLGPRGLPGFGNLLQLNRTFPFLTYGKWARYYGSDALLGIKKGSTNVVVLNSRRTALDLFERRGAVYSDRPWEYMKNTWVLKDDLRTTVFQNNSPWVTRWRRDFTHHFGPLAITKHRPVYEAETARLLVKLIESPTARKSEIQDILLCWLMSVPCIGVCGRRPDEMGDFGFDINHFRRCSSDYAALVAPHAFDIFPILTYLPNFLGLAAWKEKAQDVRARIFKCGNQFLDAAKAQRDALDAGKPIVWESMLAAMIREQREQEDEMFTPTDIGNSGVHIVTAGSGTSTAFFSISLMILAKYPEIQKRLRDEVLQMSGDAPPTAEDVLTLPYLDAFWNEVHRWRSVTPHAFPRATSQDDEYHGRQIPKGTTVLINAWHIHHSEEDYDAPHEFHPERFLQHPLGMRHDQGYASDPSETATSRVTFVFGAGRRVCPGMHSAKQSLLLGLAKVLWAFDVLPPEEGKEVDLSMETGFRFETFFLLPKDFDVVLKPRTAHTKENIMKHYAETYAVEAEILGWEK